MRQEHNCPLSWTFSCIHPSGELHCGQCNKCHERRESFHLIGVEDPTIYAALRLHSTPRDVLR